MIVLNPKPISQIREEREQGVIDQNIDLYEAVAGLFEELTTIAEACAALDKRIAKLEGGENR